MNPNPEPISDVPEEQSAGRNVDFSGGIVAPAKKSFPFGLVAGLALAVAVIVVGFFVFR